MIDQWEQRPGGGRVTGWPPESRAAEYRQRAEKTRTQADAMSDPQARSKMLEVAAMWERMADWEDKKSSPPS